MRLRFQKRRDKKEEKKEEDKIAGVDTGSIVNKSSSNNTDDYDDDEVDEPLHVTKIRISHISPSTSSSSTASMSASATASVSASISSSSLSHRSSQHGRKAGSKSQNKKLPKVCWYRSKHERSTLHRSSQESTAASASTSASTIKEKRPPSPTSVRDFARAQTPVEEKTHMEEGKEADDAWCNSDNNNNPYDRFVCNNDSIRDMWIDSSSSNTNTNTNTNTAANTSNGWDQFAKLMSLRIEDLQDHTPDDAWCNSDNNNNPYDRFVCNNDSIRDMWIDSSSSNTNTNTNTAANTSNGWDQFAKLMSLRIEDLQDHYHANLLCLTDLGDYALSALEKNRCDMDDMFGKIEGIEFSTMAAEDDLNPMSWLRENHVQVQASMDAVYDQTLTACADTTLCFAEEPLFECTGRKPRDVILVVGLPSNDTDIDSSTTTTRGVF
eukprot:CAMPEP_0172408062 /NCGR_PEP_ID=MMETSP1061-20121228/75661_1 /TAXON_ID=37318 /ORGANISM="Pseudo-nitzschia pungens, Strain cf. pungens" /LENGTH=436 /DNA_ID=CAMNT_0013144179 /DNA_START=184 /DNA_END=1495 /DNA_ORIENTATION=+